MKCAYFQKVHMNDHFYLQTQNLLKLQIELIFLDKIILMGY